MKKKTDDNNLELEENEKKCGIIMPIASHPDYPKDHWKEVLLILIEAISETEFEPRMVNDDAAIGLIHERIVTNIYNDEIVICDVSSKNPNVMFELGMRLAFDKPTIIIKDEKTGYSFDTGVIEHINYPSSLRFNQIVDFKKELIKRIKATYKKSESTTDYSPFLKSFGKTIVPAKINSSEIPESQYIISKLENLSDEIRSIRVENRKREWDHFAPNLYSEGERQIKISNHVQEFLKHNRHLSQDDVLQNFIEIIKEEVNSHTGIKPLNIEIITSINSYYEKFKIKSN